MDDKKAHLVQAWIGYLTLAIVLLSALMLGANRPLPWILLSLLVMIMFTLQVVLNMFVPSPAQLRRIILPAVLFLAMIVWAMIQVLPDLQTHIAHPFWEMVPQATNYISADPIQGRHGIMRYLTYAMVTCIIICTASMPHAAWRMLQMIAIFSTLLALYGFYAFFSGNNPIMGDGIENIAYANYLKASFVNRNSYATYAAFGALANIAIYLNSMNAVKGGRDGWIARLRDWLERFFEGSWVFAFGAIVCIGALTLTQSRAGAISAVAGLFILLRTWSARRKSDRITLGVALAFITFFALTSATGLVDRLVTTTEEEMRFTVYPAVLQGILERPLLGHGLGAFPDGFRPFLPREAAIGEWKMAHSSYLENFFELGIPAALALYAALALITIRIWHGTLNRHQNRLLPAFALACIATAALHSILDFSLQMPAAAALFAAIIGMGFAQSFGREALKSKK